MCSGRHDAFPHQSPGLRSVARCESLKRYSNRYLRCVRRHRATSIPSAAAMVAPASKRYQPLWLWRGYLAPTSPHRRHTCNDGADRRAKPVQKTPLWFAESMAASYQPSVERSPPQTVMHAFVAECKTPVRSSVKTAVCPSTVHRHRPRKNRKTHRPRALRPLRRAGRERRKRESVGGSSCAPWCHDFSWRRKTRSEGLHRDDIPLTTTDRNRVNAIDRRGFIRVSGRG